MNFITHAASVALLAFGLALPTLQAQESSHGVCGTPDEGLERLRENIAAAQAFAKTHGHDLSKFETDYIPVRFKVIGRTDGTGEASLHSIISVLEAMNRDFAPYLIQFYLEDQGGTVFDYHFSDGWFDNLSSFETFMRNNRSRNAITIYIPNNASPPSSNGIGGVTLGYYTPSLDLLVFKKTEIGNNASTASHEVGHFFGLPHTFRGWDCVSWEGAECSDPSISNPVTALVGPCNVRGGTALVELVTREAGANCAEAGDLFCDTPADYNLGFGYPNCNYVGPVLDRNNAPLRPDEDNFMGYFLNCNPYKFSGEQVAAMKADFRSTRRNFLREGNPLIERDTVKEEVTDVLPAMGSVTQYADQVTISWTAAPEATFYYLEVSTDRAFREDKEVLSEVIAAPTSSRVLTGLKANTKYYFKVRAFNQLTAAPRNTRYEFTTSSVLSGINSVEAVADLAVLPNPSAVGHGITTRLQVDQAGRYEFAILDVTGRTLSSVAHELRGGENRIDLTETANLPSGAYFLRVRNSVGVSSRRFVVQ